MALKCLKNIELTKKFVLSKPKRHIFHFHQGLYWTMCSLTEQTFWPNQYIMKNIYMLTRKDRKLSRVHFEYILAVRQKRTIRKISKWFSSSPLSSAADRCPHPLNTSMGSYLLPSAFDRWVSDWLAMSLNLLYHPLVIYHGWVIISK